MPSISLLTGVCLYQPKEMPNPGSATLEILKGVRASNGLIVLYAQVWRVLLFVILPCNATHF
jgi:hypothetical protein